MNRPIIHLILSLILLGCSLTKNKTNDHTIKSSGYLETGYYFLSRNSDQYQRQLSGTLKNYYLNPIPIITVDNFTNVSAIKNEWGYYYIRIDLNDSGGQKWSEGTGKAIGDSLAIVINNELIQVVRVNAQITAPITAINRENLTKSEADKYLSDIKAKMKSND